MKSVLFSIIVFFISCPVFSQNTSTLNTVFCVSFDQVNNILSKYHPELSYRQQELDSAYSRDMAAHTGGQRSISGTALYVLPVVVHIVHNNGAENINDAMVIRGIQDLNDAYANIGYYDSTTGVNTHIQFCLSKRDPNGNTTSGITRNLSTYTNMTLENEDLSVKNLNRWDPNCYVNIWLVKEICSSSAGCGVAGYAYFPSANGTNIDGLVAEARWFGSSQANSGVHIHEIGHYLGLYHTFEGGCVNNNCLSDGDHVCDTPPDASTAWVPCSAAPNSCSTDALSGFSSDQPDLFQDYMDYSDLHCYSVFTQGQADRMKWTMDHVRSNLMGCRSCLSPCTSPAAASFSSSAHSVQTGMPVTFTNSSTNSTTYSWSANGINFSSIASPSYVFTAPGIYVVKLSSNNADPNCYADALDTITVTCSAHAAFTYPNAPVGVAPNVAIAFTNQSTGATSYSWAANGTFFSTAASPSYTFPANGTYWVKLTATNAYCSNVDSFRMFVCSPCIEICDNGIDDDGNNLFDCIDPACSCNKCSSAQANNWYFGLNAALDFGTSPPTVVSGSPLVSNEGNASISDANGHLLFYTNGETVWGRDNQVMPNGTSLISNTSSTTCLIIPAPGDQSTYYIFHVGCADVPNTKGFRYTIVDMSMNYGMGDVDVAHKNVTIIGPSTATEKIAAVRHCDNKSVWICTHEYGNNVYDAFLLDSTGMHITPVVSHIGTTYTTTVAASDYIGFMKFSADGKRLAAAIYNSNKIDVSNFNNTTGAFSNTLTITGYGPTCYYYGVEFSPTGKLLYATNQYNTSHLFQYDVSLGTAAAITASQIILDSLSAPLMYSGLQTAPDGHVYVSIGSSSSNVHSHYLAGITRPNIRGFACGLDPQAVNLGPGFGNFGLPSFLQNYFIQKVNIDGPDSICGGAQDQVYRLIAERSCEAVTTWSIVSGSAVIASQSDSAVTIHFNAKGVVKLAVTVSNTCNAGTDTITIYNIRGANLNLGPDTVECYAGVTVLNAGAGFRSYQWQNGSSDSTYTAYGAGRYYVTVHDYCGATASDTVSVTVDSSSQVYIGRDTTVCKGHSVVLSGPTNAGSSFLWSPNYAISSTTGPIVTVNPQVTTVYTLAVKNKSGCTTLATRKITVDVCTGIDEAEILGSFEIVPNPAHNGVHIILANPDKANSIYIYNALGQQMYYSDARKESDLSVDLLGLAQGIYIISVKYADGSSVTRRLVKE